MVETSLPAVAAAAKVEDPQVRDLMVHPATSSSGLGYIRLSPGARQEGSRRPGGGRELLESRTDRIWRG